MICPICAHENCPGDRFCEECGQPLGRRCPKCGEAVRSRAKFCSACGTPLDQPGDESAGAPAHRLAVLQNNVPPALREKMRLALPEVEGARKPVTILFTDIAGSTALAEQMDPEDWREIVNGAHRCVSQAVYHYEGTIAQLLGDGVLAFFGAPITHEDDPLRAVLAAIDIQSANHGFTQSLPPSAPNFQLRVGIHTGTVVVGNIGHDLHTEYLAVGDAVNLAARLQSAAEPGGIIISQEMARAVEHAVRLVDLGEVAVKGKRELVRMYKVIQVEGIHGHGRRPLECGPNRLVGRQAEMQALLAASAAVQAGLGRVVVMTGEPGLGKSRLIQEWQQREPGGLRRVNGECLSYGEGLPYHLVRSWLYNLLEISPGASEQAIQQALRKLANDLFGEGLAESYAFLAHLLSVSIPEAEAHCVQGLNPQGFQVQYLATLRRLLLALAERGPLALIFEDIHWSDPSSVEILSKLLPLAKEAPLLFCFITRPEQGVPGWRLVEAGRSVMGGGLVEIALQPLAEGEVEQMAASMLNSQQLPEEVQKLVIERAEGNPLFVEELVGILMEKGVLVQESGRWRATGSLAEVSLPANLARLMLARIDRLPEPSKRTLRVAAVIGRQFLLHTLEDVLKRIGQDEMQPRLLSYLSELEFSSLIRLAATRPEIAYLFRHALVQEAVYEAVLKSERRWLHRATAEVLESAYPDRLDELAPTLAYHFEHGEARERALYYLERAGDRADQSYANAEAAALYRAAIEQAQALSRQDPPVVDCLRIAGLQMKLGDILLRIGQHESARSAYETGMAVLPKEQALFRARLLHRTGNAYLVPRMGAKAHEAFLAAKEAMGGEPGGFNWEVVDMEASSREAAGLWIDIQLDTVWACYWLADREGTKKAIEQVTPAIERIGTPSQRALYYYRLVTMEFQGSRCWPDEKIVRHALDGVAAAQEAGNLVALCMAHFILGLCRLWRNELDEAVQRLSEGLRYAERTGDMDRRVLCTTHMTNTYRRQKNVEQTRLWAERANAIAGEANMQFYVAGAMGNLAWAAYMDGSYQKAEELARAAQVVLKNGLAQNSYGWPLLAICLMKDQLKEARDMAQVLIQPEQIRLPDEVDALMRAGIDQYAAGALEQCKQSLVEAVRLAQETGYF